MCCTPSACMHQLKPFAPPNLMYDFRFQTSSWPHAQNPTSLARVSRLLHEFCTWLLWGLVRRGETELTHIPVRRSEALHVGSRHPFAKLSPALPLGVPHSF